MKNSTLKKLKLIPNGSKVIHLTQSLKSFGLKPNEWVVINIGNNVFKIENLESPDFYFEGVVKQQSGLSTWGKIYLKSI